MFKDHKKAYWLFVLIMTTMGVVFLVLSMFSSVSNGVTGLAARERRIYFDRKILPDHLFYPVLMILDKIKLDAADKETQTLLKIDYAEKRLVAAKTLFVQGKNDLAFVTAGKAHQYLLQANREAVAGEEGKKYTGLIKEMNQNFAFEYENLKQYLTDGQKVTIDDWGQQLWLWQNEGKERQKIEMVEATQEGQLQ